MQYETEKMNEFRENTCEETLFLREGSCLNRRYCIEKCIGQGGFGIVYLAYDEVLKRKIAIKEYMPMESLKDAISPLGTNALPRYTIR